MSAAGYLSHPHRDAQEHAPRPCRCQQLMAPRDVRLVDHLERLGDFSLSSLLVTPDVCSTAQGGHGPGP